MTTILRNLTRNRTLITSNVHHRSGLAVVPRRGSDEDSNRSRDGSLSRDSNPSRDDNHSKDDDRSRDGNRSRGSSLSTDNNPSMDRGDRTRSRSGNHSGHTSLGISVLGVSRLSREGPDQ